MSGRDNLAVIFLTRLLALSERTPDRTRPASLAADYDELRTADAMSRFKEQIRGGERSGAVSVRNGKRERSHLIERVTVKDPSALARHLGRNPASSLAKAARFKLDPLIAGGDSWLTQILDEMEARWSRGETAFRLQADDTKATQEFLALLAAISKDQARGLDGRTFSLRVTGDTKAFDRHSTRIAGVMANGKGTLVDGRAKPFASVHPEMVALLKLSAQPALLLTIENYASFNRYVREIDDDALVIYTGGFASVGVIEILKSLLRMLDTTVPFFHWGDIDPGGLRIFRFLEESLPRRLRPHLMDRVVAEAHGKSASRDPTLGMIAKTDSAIASIVDWLAQGEDVRHLEQEALDPVSPLSEAAPEAKYVLGRALQK